MATKTDTFTPTISLSGYIRQVIGLGSTYTVYSGEDAVCGADYAAPAGDTQYAAFFSFDTSSLPSDAVISTVRFYLSFYGQASADGPDNWKNRWFMGTFIGSSLDSSDWGGGTAMKIMDWEGTPGAPTEGWVDFRAAAKDYVNLSGATDVRMIDYSDESAPYGSWQIVVYNNSRTKLEITYDYTPVIDEGDSVFYNLGG